MDYQAFFDRYVFGSMCADVERAIQAAREDEAKSVKVKGQVMCALSLLAHTEYMANLLPDSLRPSKNAKPGDFFNAFFKQLGTPYEDLLNLNNIYNIFRCGLTHEYFVKRACTIAFFNRAGLLVKGNKDALIPQEKIVEDVRLDKKVDIAIGQASNGHFYFVIEKYLEDFRSACERLLDKLVITPTTDLPEIDASEWGDTG